MKPIRLLSAAFWKLMLGRLGGGASSRDQPVADAESLSRFIQTRAAHVAQTSLYGYLRTRAGTRFPELFSNDAFVVSINIAKWHVWLACVSDLAVYAGGLAYRRSGGRGAAVGPLMIGVVDSVLRETGTPEEAGERFAEHAGQLRARIALCDWAALTEGETPFAQSPEALVHWAPVVDEFKKLDEEIVRNSVRFRWLEVRQNLQKVLDADALLAQALPAVAADAGATDGERRT